MKTIVPVVAAAVLALALIPASAAPMHHKRHTKAATAAQPQIACTVVGCMPVPRGCHPEMGYTPGGTPTGFDVAGMSELHALRKPPLAETRGSPAFGPTMPVSWLVLCAFNGEINQSQDSQDACLSVPRQLLARVAEPT